MDNDENQYFKELDKFINCILESTALKKLIVAGPGTGKTTFFRKAIEYYGRNKNDYLVLTFINNLEAELQKDLGDISKVYTFHGFCHYLLRKDSNLRFGLEDEFEYYPPVIKLIGSDWQTLKNKKIPKFVNLMRRMESNEEMDFFLSRGNYYNATGYDDSVYRVFRTFDEGKKFKKQYKLVIVDEYQDFNALETKVLSYVIESNPALIVGDDDQALYCNLRDSSPDFIRGLFKDKNYENFELPFCLRCPNATIAVFKEFVEIARGKDLLGGRIDKKFNFFPPIKGKDSEKYPVVKLVVSSVQKKSPSSTNYFGRYILQEIQKISDEEISESHNKLFPTVLIIGPKFYLESITPIFENEDYDYELSEVKQSMNIEIDEGFKILIKNERSNLGWRIILEALKPDFLNEVIEASFADKDELIELLPKDFIEEINTMRDSFEVEEDVENEEVVIDRAKPSIKLTTFEGAKGLSAQHVFIVGLQDGLLPKNSKVITDIEICKFLVALTRTRKQCHLLSAKNFGGQWIEPSEFLKWITDSRYVDIINIDKNYWK